MALYDSILDTIGRTPIVRLHRLPPKHVELYVKVEAFNPGGSVKDRLALAIVLDAERRGLLKPGDTIVEATSGNTGVALAMVAAARGYKFVAVMTETFSVERRKLMRAYGAKVILTPAAERGSGMVRKAEELARKHGWFLARQFENEANPAWHRSTTGPEILQDFVGRRLDYFVSGWGTGGTLTGVGQTLKLARPEVKIISSDPPAPSCSAARTGSRTRSRAGPRTSCPPCSTARWWMPSSRWTTCWPATPPAASPPRRGSSSASPPAPPWPPRWKWRRKRKKARSSSPCCPTPASATSARSCSRGSARARTTSGWRRWTPERPRGRQPERGAA
jgi:cysteine synthase